MHVVQSTGAARPGWPFLAPVGFEGPASIGDLDLDGDLEIVWGANIADRGPGWIYAANEDGSAFGESHVLVELPEGIVRTPLALVDLAGDPRPEIVTSDRQGRIRAYTAAGEALPGWPPPSSYGYADGMPVAIGALGGPAEAIWVSTDGGYSYVLDRFGSMLPGWPWEGSWLIRSQPVVGDLDGDVGLEGFIGGSNPFQWALELDGTVVEGWPLRSGTNDFGTGALADLDGDGDTEIVFQGYDGFIHAYDTPGRYDYRRIECYRYMYDNWHTGSYHKDIYREAESGELRPGWQVVPDSTAWGGALLRPKMARVERYPLGEQIASAASSSPRTGVETPTPRAERSEGARGRRVVPPPVQGRAEVTLAYRAEVPVWEEYSLWVRARPLEQATPEASKIRARLDGAPIPPGTNEPAPSPGGWWWLEVGRIPIETGLHALSLEVSLPAPELDRWLLTTREGFPLLEERPHGW